MTSLLAVSSSGLQAAQLRLAASAHNVANAQTPAFARQQVNLQAAPGLGGVQAGSAPAASPEGVALPDEAVEQIAAGYAFKANALVLRTADEVLGTLLDTHA